LKAKLAEQQKQIEVLRQSVDAQQKLIERLTTPAARPAEQAASHRRRRRPASPARAAQLPAPLALCPTCLPWLRAPNIGAGSPAGAATSSPLQIQIGNVTIMRSASWMPPPCGATKRRFGYWQQFRQHSVQQCGSRR